MTWGVVLLFDAVLWWEDVFEGMSCLVVVLVAVSFFEEGGAWRLGRRRMFLDVGARIYEVCLSREKRMRDCSKLVLEGKLC